MSAEIVKVQRPWSSNMTPVPGRCLVYAKDHTNVREQIVPAEVWNALSDQTGRKGYFHATWNPAEGGSWEVGDPAPRPDW